MGFQCGTSAARNRHRHFVTSGRVIRQNLIKIHGQELQEVKGRSGSTRVHSITPASLCFSVLLRGGLSSAAVTNELKASTRPRSIPGSHYMSYGSIMGGGAPAQGPNHHLCCHQMLQQGRYIRRVTHCLFHTLARQ